MASAAAKKEEGAETGPEQHGLGGSKLSWKHVLVDKNRVCWQMQSEKRQEICLVCPS